MGRTGAAPRSVDGRSGRVRREMELPQPPPVGRSGGKKRPRRLPGRPYLLAAGCLQPEPPLRAEAEAPEPHPRPADISGRQRAELRPRRSSRPGLPGGEGRGPVGRRVPQRCISGFSDCEIRARLCFSG